MSWKDKQLASSNSLGLSGTLTAEPDPNRLSQSVRLSSASRQSGSRDVETAGKQTSTEVVFIDAGVERVDLLLQGIRGDVAVYSLDCASDGVLQITQLLSQYQDLSAIHIVSHGRPGEVRLGAAQLNVQSLCNGYAEAISQWSKALRAQGEVLLYGCRVAASATGRNFVDQLAQRLNATIAAASSLVGSLEQGGQWQLDVTTGLIQTPLAFKPELIASYDAVFGSSPIRINVGGGAYTDTLGNIWQTDNFFTGGVTYSSTASIANTVNDPLYQSERYGNFSYTIPVVNGTYAVKLLLSELYWASPGSRIFDISVGGQLVQDNLDIFAQAGLNNAYEVVLNNVVVTNGLLTLGFATEVDNATLSGIEILEATAGLLLTPTGSSTDVTEGGTTDSYGVVLNTQPTANVTVTLNGGSQLTTNVTSLTFTPANWNVAQTVTVTAVNDTVVEGNHTGTITHTVSSTDPNYTGLTIAPMSVAITDNDTNVVPGSIFINAGGGAYTDGLGQVWSADQLFTGGGTYSTTAAIANTTSDPLFQNERTGVNFSYAIPVANGTYEVDLGFSELYFDGANARVFSVTGEGQTLLSNYDLWADAGGKNQAVVKTFTVNVTDGTLNLNFAASKDQAKVDFIHVTPTTPTPGVTTVQSGGNTAVTEGGATDTYSLVLNTQPTANVTVTLNGGSQLTTNVTSLTFTPANWNVAQTVTVTAVNDTVVEGNHTGTITHTVSSSDANYNGLTLSPLTVAITDNDSNVVPGSILINGGGGTYTDGLGQAWSADQLFTGGTVYSSTAAIANTTSDALFQTERTGATFSYAIPVANGTYEVDLGFAELYWDAANARVFSVTGEGQTLLSNYDIWSDAGGKNQAVVKTFTVNVTDGVLNLGFSASKDQAKVSFVEVIPTTPVPGVTPSQSGGNTTVTEGGATDSYGVVLNTQPTANVTVTLNGGSQLTTNVTSLTFTPANWNVAQTVTVTAVNDTVVEGNHTGTITHTVSSSDANYNGLTLSPLTVAITDNDTNVVPGSILINGGGGTYTDGLGQAWSADQLFTGGTVYSSTAAIANTTSDALFQTERTGANFSYAIPVANGIYEVDLGFAELYWDAANARVFSVTGEGQTLLSNYDLWSDAGGKNQAVVKTFTVNVTDGVLNLGFSASKDQAKVSFVEVIPTVLVPGGILTQSGGNTAVTEGGTTDSYGVVLNTQPTANVTVTLNGGSQLTTNVTSLTFTPANWNVAQTVTVTAVNDTVVEGNHTGTITHTVSSSDANYNGLILSPLTVAITDNDTNTVPGSIFINAGGGAYTDSLGQVWSADQFVTGGFTYSTTAAIANTTSDPLFQDERTGVNFSYGIPVANGTYEVDLGFAEIYWNAANARLFSVTGEGQTLLSNYDVWTDAGGQNTAIIKKFNVNVTDGILNLDFAASKDDAQVLSIEVVPIAPLPGVTPVPSGGSTTVTEGGTTDTYSLVLTTQPTANVTVALNPGTQLTISASTLTFTPANWNVAQTVTVTAVNDTVVEGNHTGTITHTVSSADPNYNGVTIPPVNVSITDNDGSLSVIRINVGGGAYTDTVGNIWQADNFFTGGSTYSTTAPIFKTEDDPLYQTERSAANLSYQIPITNGNYLVKLHFAETYWDDFNQRVFDVSIENNLAFDDIDIFARSKNAFFPGKDSALVLSKSSIHVSDGLLNLDLTASVDNAKLSAIEIIPLEGAQVIFQETNGQTIVSEAGVSDTYLVVLNTQPAADVTINVGVNSQITTNKTALTFTSANWNIPQVVTVAAIDDTLEEGTHFTNITHTVTSADSSYSNLSLTALPVTVQDNDVVAISFTKKTVATNVDALGTYAKGATTAAWGPDGRLYVGTYSGEIKAYTFDDDYNVIATQSITTLTGLYNKDILGITFNPFDDPSAPVKIYVAHSQLYGNGGASFPVTEQSKYSGQISILGGPNFSTVTPLITGLPVSNHDHGINGMDFDAVGNLYISVGSNTNAGIPESALGGLPESPLTAAILKAEITKPNFNGAITYSLPSNFVPPNGLTFDPATSQVFGDVANIVPGSDVSVYASGFRNPYDVVWTTKGLLYATNNGSNTGFGDVSTSATTQQPFTITDADELNLVIQDAYYGHPNRNRGRYDARQNVFYSAFDNGIPGVVTAPLATTQASTNGVTEYRATTFGGQLRGDLLAQKWNGSIYDFSLSSDGQAVTKTEVLNGISDGLDILTGPGGAIVGIDFSDNSITVALPNDVAAFGTVAYDIFPWRAPAIGGSDFVIGGLNFGTLGNTSVTIGGQIATLTSVSATRIRGVFPSLSVPVGNDLVDLVVQSGGQTSVITDAFLPLPTIA